MVDDYQCDDPIPHSTRVSDIDAEQSIDNGLVGYNEEIAIQNGLNRNIFIVSMDREDIVIPSNNVGADSYIPGTVMVVRRLSTGRRLRVGKNKTPTAKIWTSTILPKQLMSGPVFLPDMGYYLATAEYLDDARRRLSGKRRIDRFETNIDDRSDQPITIHAMTMDRESGIDHLFVHMGDDMYCVDVQPNLTGNPRYNAVVITRQIFSEGKIDLKRDVFPISQFYDQGFVQDFGKGNLISSNQQALSMRLHQRRENEKAQQELTPVPNVFETQRLIDDAKQRAEDRISTISDEYDTKIRGLEDKLKEVKKENKEYIKTIDDLRSAAFDRRKAQFLESELYVEAEKARVQISDIKDKKRHRWHSSITAWIKSSSDILKSLVVIIPAGIALYATYKSATSNKPEPKTP